MVGGERGTKTVAITVINLRKESGRIRDPSSDPLFSGPIRLRLTYRAPPFKRKHWPYNSENFMMNTMNIRRILFPF